VANTLEQASSLSIPQVVNALPELQLNQVSTNVLIGRPSAAIAPNLQIIDSDGGTLPGARVFVDNYDAAQDSLGIVGQTGTSGTLAGTSINWTINSTTGVVSFDGLADNSAYQQALRQVTYSTTSTTPSTAPRNVQFVLGNLLANPENGHFYRFINNNGVSWTDANAAAAADSQRYLGLQGYLATITSSREQAFIQQRVQGNGWIGASDFNTPDNWRWVTGPEGQENGGAGRQFWSGRTAADGGSALPGRYSNWQTDEPNNFGDGEFYAHIIGDATAYDEGSSAIGKWNDLANSGSTGAFRPLGYIIEYGGFSGEATLKLTGSVAVNVRSQSLAITGGSNITLRNNASGQNAILQLNGATLVDFDFITPVPDKNWTMVASGDFNGDGKDDLLWRNYTTGDNAIWLMNGFNNLNATSQKSITRVADTDWKMIAAADFDGDNKADILWRNDRTGENAVWFMDATSTTTDGRYASDEQFFANRIRTVDKNWKMVGAGNFDDDNKADILWRNEVTGENAIWLMNGTRNTPVASKANGEKFITSVAGSNWNIAGIGDFDANSKSDIVWRNSSTGENAVWTVNTSVLTNSGNFFSTNEQFIKDENGVNVVVPRNDWRIEAVGDTNNDGKSDLIWRNYANDTNAVWRMDGAIAATAGRQLVTNASGTVRTGDINWDIVDSYIA
jgi:translation initiation factor IF-1